MATQRDDDHYVDPDTWLVKNPPHDGSWWPALAGWLGERSGARGPLPPLGLAGSRFAPLEDAPGRYIFMK
jgi:polyhydroxyalkanoate synthase